MQEFAHSRPLVSRVSAATSSMARALVPITTYFADEPTETLIQKRKMIMIYY